MQIVQGMRSYMHNTLCISYMLSVGIVVHRGMSMQDFLLSNVLNLCTRNFEKSEFLEGCLDAFHIGECPS